MEFSGDRSERPAAKMRAPSQEEFVRVAEHMLDRLRNIFGDPKAFDPDAFYDEYVNVLKHFNSEELHEGTENLMRTMKFTKWPTPAECISACRKARQFIELRNNPPKRVHRDPSAQPVTDGAERRAIAKMRSDRSISDRACRDGWALGLRDFLMAHDRFPDRDEERVLIEAAGFRRDCVAGRVDMGPLAPGLMNLAVAMQVKETDIIAELQGS